MAMLVIARGYHPGNTCSHPASAAASCLVAVAAVACAKRPGELSPELLGGPKKCDLVHPWRNWVGFPWLYNHHGIISFKRCKVVSMAVATLQGFEPFVTPREPKTQDIQR